MKQVIFGKTYNNVGDLDLTYTPLKGSAWASSGLANARCKHPWSVAGSFKNLYVEILWPQENPSSYNWPDLTFTIYVNDTPTALTVTVPGASGAGGIGFTATAQDVTHTAAITPGQTVALVRGPGTIVPGINASTAFIAWTLTFESTNDGESGYGLSAYASSGIGSANLYVSSPFYDLGGMALETDVIDEPSAHGIVPLEGSLTRIDVLLGTSPGAGATRTYAAQLDEVIQDGTGGTIDTQVAISGSATTGHLEFDLPISVLQRLSIVQLISVGTAPAASTVEYGIRLTATTDGEFVTGFMTGAAHPIDDGSTDFAGAADGGWAWTTARAPTPSANPSRWPMSEYSMSLPGPIDPVTLSSLCVNLTFAPGTGKSWNFETRKALASTSSVNVISDTDVLTIGTGATDTYFSPTDRLDLQVIASGGTPHSTQVGWTWAVAAATTPPIVTTSYPIRRLRRCQLLYDQNKWIRINRIELILQAGVGLSTGQGSNPIVMFRLSRDGGMTWDSELTMEIGRIGEYERRAFLNMLGRARNPVVEFTSSDPVFTSWISLTVDYDEGTS